MYTPFETFSNLPQRLQRNIIQHLKFQSCTMLKPYFLKTQLTTQNSNHDPLDMSDLLDEYLRLNKNAQFICLSLPQSNHGFGITGQYSLKGEFIEIKACLCECSAVVAQLPIIRCLRTKKGIRKATQKLVKLIQNSFKEQL